MSIASLTTLAAARDERAPVKGDVAKAKHGDAKAAEPASTKDVLVAQVPTEAVAPYTAISAIIVGLVAKPTAAHPHPDQLAIWRWGAFALLMLAIIVFVYTGTKGKSPDASFPLLAIAGALVAGIGWAFLMPGGPLAPYLHSKAASTLAPPFVGFGAVILAAATASGLKKKKGGGK